MMAHSPGVTANPPTQSQVPPNASGSPAMWHNLSFVPGAAFPGHTPGSGRWETLSETEHGDGPPESYLESSPQFTGSPSSRPPSASSAGVDVAAADSSPNQNSQNVEQYTPDQWWNRMAVQNFSSSGFTSRADDSTSLSSSTQPRRSTPDFVAPPGFVAQAFLSYQTSSLGGLPLPVTSNHGASNPAFGTTAVAPALNFHDNIRKFMKTMVFTLAYFVLDLPTQVYLSLLLRIPALYFSRVTRIFEDADLSRPDIKRMARATAAQWNSADKNTKGARMLFTNQDLDALPQDLLNFRFSWERFIDSLTREWKTLNIISALLLSAILTMLQIEAAAHPVIRTSALFSLICALMSLLYGCIYIIRFGTMKPMHKASSFAYEAQNRTPNIWWNVWILLAMPAIWLAWSIILFLTCIMSFIWLNGSTRDLTTSERASLGPRVGLTVIFFLALAYFVLIVKTFYRYGAASDRKWTETVHEWAHSEVTPHQQWAALSPSGVPSATPQMGSTQPTYTPSWPSAHVRLDTAQPMSPSPAGTPRSAQIQLTEAHLDQFNRHNYLNTRFPDGPHPMVGSRPASAPPLTTPSIDILREPRPPVTQLLSALSYGTPSGNGPPSGPAWPLSFEQPPLSHHSPSQVLPPRTPSLGNISLPQSQPFVDLKDWPALHWHAPHAILAQGSMYPSAMHLHASKRYYPQNLPFAELIRLCPDVNDVHALSERLALESPTSVRSDWDTSFMTSMEDVLLLMFTQHPDLCAILLWTGDMPIVFSSEQDLFWGQNGPGGPGLNHYGHLLEQVRERLRDPTRRRKVHFVETGAQEGE